MKMFFISAWKRMVFFIVTCSFSIFPLYAATVDVSSGTVTYASGNDYNMKGGTLTFSTDASATDTITLFSETDSGILDIPSQKEFNVKLRNAPGVTRGYVKLNVGNNVPFKADTTGFSGTILGQSTATSERKIWVYGDYSSINFALDGYVYLIANAKRDSYSFGNVSSDSENTVIRAGGGIETTIKVGAANADATFAGTIRETTKPVSLLKEGTGTWTLTNSHTASSTYPVYTGTTTINAGAIKLDGSGRLGGGNIIVNTDGRLILNPSETYTVDDNYTIHGALELTGGTTSITGGTFNEGSKIILNGGTVNHSGSTAREGKTLYITKNTNNSITGSTHLLPLDFILASDVSDAYLKFPEVCNADFNTSTENFSGKIFVNRTDSSATNTNLYLSTVADHSTVHFELGGYANLTGNSSMNFQIGNLSSSSANSKLRFGGTSKAEKFTIGKTGVSGENTTFAGTIINGGASSLSLIKQGDWTWTLTGTNTYTGGTDIQEGVISVAKNDRLGADSANLTLSGGTLEMTGGTWTLSRNLILTPETDSTIHVKNGYKILGYRNSNQTVTGWGNLTLKGDESVINYASLEVGTLTVPSDVTATCKYGPTQWIAGNINGNIAVANSTAGTLLTFKTGQDDVTKISGNITNSTVTSVSTFTAADGKTLQVDGILTGKALSNGLGRLDYKGTITNGLEIMFGIFSPGNSVGTTTLSGGDFTLGSGAQLLIEFSEDGSVWDQILLEEGVSAMAAEGSVLTFNLNGYTPRESKEYPIFTGLGSMGEWLAATQGLDVNWAWDVTTGALSYTAVPAPGVPEPATWVLLLLGLTSMVYICRVK